VRPSRDATRAPLHGATASRHECASCDFGEATERLRGVRESCGGQPQALAASFAAGPAATRARSIRKVGTSPSRVTSAIVHRNSDRTPPRRCTACCTAFPRPSSRLSRELQHRSCSSHRSAPLQFNTVGQAAPPEIKLSLPSCSRPRASGSLMRTSEPEARGREEHEHLLLIGGARKHC
jgi:hypothetical protein